MANLTRELMIDLVPNYPPIEIVRPIQAAQAVHQGNWLTIDTSYHVGTWTAGERTVGLCKQSVDNTAGAAAAKGRDVKLIVGGAIRWYIANATEADIGKAVFNITDNQTLSLTPRAGGYIGRIVDVVSGLCTILIDTQKLGREQWESWFDLADDATVNLPDATAAMVTVACGAEFIYANVGADGAVTLAGYGESDVGCISANGSITDVDAKLCLFDGGTAATIKNRLAATKRVFVRYFGLPTA